MMEQIKQNSAYEPKNYLTEKIIMDEYIQIRDKVTDAVFYGCGDEAYEQWSTMCLLCYQLCSLGDLERGKVVLGWIEEIAEENKKWYKEEYGELNPEDSQNGNWGY